ncbi:Hypothetical predicted protein [Marmota monax]|uniref:Uncharacterized protein n=1 Tax=Marmota monax TaxID=9995 RepID=A0A5E4CRY8_MARMO|nr:hypothetical protein GHT09_015284 [Marmota monax]VTJ84583.1 Hypothetical predicted protein [Marmota monax]
MRRVSPLLEILLTLPCSRSRVSSDSCIPWLTHACRALPALPCPALPGPAQARLLLSGVPLCPQAQPLRAQLCLCCHFLEYFPLASHMAVSQPVSLPELMSLPEPISPRDVTS